MRKTTLSITLLVLAVAALAALRAPAVAPQELGRALAAQRELAARHPADAQVQNDLGNLLLLAGETGEAEEAYRRALELAPEMTSARYNLALLLLQTDRPRAALRELRRVIEDQPDNAWAHYQIGVVHEQAGAERKAVRRYARAFRLDPQLGFPEVNPHVIQNEHVVEAMLLAYRKSPAVGQAPKSYEQPGRIVSLMLPPEGSAAAPGEPPAAEGEPAAEGAAPEGVRPRPVYPEEAPGEPPAGEEGEGRVLRQEDLESGDVNRAVVPGTVSRPSRSGTQPRGGTRTPVRTLTPPGSQGREPGARPQPAPPGQQRFVPGVPSTGRLEIELVPGGGDEVAAAG